MAFCLVAKIVVFHWRAASVMKTCNLIMSGALETHVLMKKGQMSVYDVSELLQCVNAWWVEL